MKQKIIQHATNAEYIRDNAGSNQGILKILGVKIGTLRCLTMIVLPFPRELTTMTSVRSTKHELKNWHK